MWRAYIRKESFGKKGTPNLAKLGEQYREGKATGTIDTATLHRLGQAATDRGRTDPPAAGASAFGPKGRQQKKKTFRDLRSALCASTKNLSIEDKAVAIGGELVHASADVAIVLSLARSVIRDDARTLAQDSEARAAALQSWREEIGEAIVAQAVQDLPSLNDGRWIAVPFGKSVGLELRNVDGEDVGRVAAWAMACKATNIGHALRRHWAEDHETLMEEDCAVCLPDEDAKRKRICLDAGMCLCCDSGRMLYSFRNKFLLSLKRAFPPNSSGRASLVGGNILVKFVRRPPAGADYEAILADDDPYQEVFLHISLMYLSPFRPTFQLLHKASDVNEMDPHPDRIYVKATLMWMWVQTRCQK